MKKYTAFLLGTVSFCNVMIATMPAIETARAKADQARQGTGVSLKDILAQQGKEGAPVQVTLNGNQIVYSQQEEEKSAVQDKTEPKTVQEEAEVGEHEQAAIAEEFCSCACYDDLDFKHTTDICQQIDDLFQSLYWSVQDDFVQDMYRAMASSKAEAKELLRIKIQTSYSGELLKFLFFVQCLSDEWYALSDLLENKELCQSQSDDIKDRVAQASRYFGTLKHVWFFVDMLLDEE